MALRRLEDITGRRVGDVSDPLLVSVRSGAKFSMPGMMETVLNVGLNDDSVQGLAEAASNPRFAWDSYRRLIQMFGKTVLGIEGDVFASALDAAKAAAGVTADVELDADAMHALVETFKALVLEHTGPRVPPGPARAAGPRRPGGLRVVEHRPGPAVPPPRADPARPGHRGQRGGQWCSATWATTSGTGVCFTRDPATGRAGRLRRLPGQRPGRGRRGRDPQHPVAGGLRRPCDPASYAELRAIMRRLETHYRDLCDIEFTVERGKLWMLQTRVGKRTAAAAFRIAVQLVDEGLITLDEALSRVSAASSWPS